MVVAPLVNSYKRLVPHYEAPVYICWGYGNRSALVRVPQYPKGVGQYTRIEYRHPDPSSNPYLVAVTTLRAGMDGMSRRTEPEEPFSENVYTMSKEELERRGVGMLPEHLGEAADAFASDPVVSGALGGYISKSLLGLKRREFEDYLSLTGRGWAETRSEITSWEIDRYLTRC